VVVTQAGTTTTTTTKTTTPFNPEYVGADGKIDQRKLFNYLLPDGKCRTMPELRQAVMNVARIQSFNFAGKVIEEAVAGEIIFTIVQDNVTYYQISPTLF